MYIVPTGELAQIGYCVNKCILVLNLLQPPGLNYCAHSLEAPGSAAHEKINIALKNFETSPSKCLG